METIKFQEITGKHWHSWTFTTSFKITDSSEEQFHWFPLVDEEQDLFHKDDFKKAGDLGTSLLKRINEIPGVRALYIDQYSIDVLTDRKTPWEEIEPKILEALSKCIIKNIKQIVN